MDKLITITLHSIFGGLITVVGGFLGFILGIRFYTAPAHDDSSYFTIGSFIVGSLIALVAYIRRFIMKSNKIYTYEK